MMRKKGQYREKTLLRRVFNQFLYVVQVRSLQLLIAKPNTILFVAEIGSGTVITIICLILVQNSI